VKRYRVHASALVRAPARRVYAILADYRDAHPRILPRRYFRALEVERGGVGAGTVFRLTMRVLGRTETSRAEVTEPEPGRVLMEAVVGGGPVTTFTVTPAGAQGRESQVTISTELPTRAGPLLAPLERLVTGLVLRRVYAEELAMLAAYAEAAERGGATQTGAGRGTG